MYTLDGMVYITDLYMNVMGNFSIGVIGHEPSQLYVTDFGDVYVGWNTLLFVWRIGEEKDDDGGGGDDGSGLSGVVIGVIVGVSVLVVGLGLGIVIKVIRARRLKKIDQNSDNRTLLIT